MGFLQPAAINTFVSFFNTSEPSLKLPMTGSSFPYLLQAEDEVVVEATAEGGSEGGGEGEEGGWGGGGEKLGGMIDVELVSCITNSPLLHRQRRAREREGG